MKKATLTLLLLASQTLMFSQLTLESVDGKRHVQIATGTDVGLKFPHQTSTGLLCESYQFYRGILQSCNQEIATLDLKKQETAYSDSANIAKKITVEYGFLQQKMETPVPLDNLQLVVEYPASRKAMDGMGGLLMAAGVIHALITGPMLSDDSRRRTDKLMWGSFGLGLTLAIWPNKKVYHLEQPVNGKPRRLWRLKG